MTITYPLAAPSTPNPSSSSIEPMASVGITRSPFSYQTQVQEHGGEAWRLAVQLPPMARSDAEAWIALFLSLNGSYGTFLYSDLSSNTVLGTASSDASFAVNGASETGRYIAVDGLAAGVTILKGTFLQFGVGSGARLVKVVEDFVASGAGAGTLTIWPQIPAANTADDTSISFTTPQGCFRLAEMPSYTISTAIRFGLSFNAVSVI
jgi:hypothetical protein